MDYGVYFYQRINGMIALTDGLSEEQCRIIQPQLKRLANYDDAKEQIEEIKGIIRKHRPEVPVHTTTFGRIESGWLNSAAPWDNQTEEPVIQSADITLKKYLLRLNPGLELKKLQKFIEMFLDDTYRVKGFVEVQGEIYLVNCVGSIYQAERFEGKPEHVNDLVILSGNGLPVKKSLKKAMEWYPEIAAELKK